MELKVSRGRATYSFLSFWSCVCHNEGLRGWWCWSWWCGAADDDLPFEICGEQPSVPEQATQMATDAQRLQLLTTLRQRPQPGVSWPQHPLLTLTPSSSCSSRSRNGREERRTLVPGLHVPQLCCDQCLPPIAQSHQLLKLPQQLLVGVGDGCRSWVCSPQDDHVECISRTNDYHAVS